jgi:flagellar motor switch protein FliN/FliY
VADNDDLLTPDEIEALMTAARSGPASGGAAQAPSVAPAGETPEPPSAAAALPGGGVTSAAVTSAPPGGEARPQPRGRAVSGTEQLLQQAERQLAAAMASEVGRTNAPPPELGPPQDYRFADLGDDSLEPSPPAFPIVALQDVELDLRIELGRTELLIEEVLQLREGTVVPLDKLAGDPVDILVNGRLIARGEVLVLNDNFCVRVAEILTPDV